MYRSLKTDDYRSEKPISVGPGDDIVDVIDLLYASKLSGVTVVDDDNNVVGVISELDCLRAVLDGSYHGQINGIVSDYMTREVDSADPESDLIALAQHMIEHRRRRLPIVRDGKFLGQYSARSVLGAISRYRTRFTKKA